MPFRLDRNWFWGGVMVYVQEDIPSKKLAKYNLADNIECIFIEIGKKAKCSVFGTYRPPSQSVEHFLNI